MDRQLTKANKLEQGETLRDLRLLDALAKPEHTCVMGKRSPRKDVTGLKISEDKEKASVSLAFACNTNDG
jgi:hypothetical protein